jgi:hypothetical protein
MIAMILALGFALALIRPMRGRFADLREARFRLEWLLPLGLILQVAGPRLGAALGQEHIEAWTLVFWLLGNAVLLVACAVNWNGIGFRLATLGVSLNIVVILLNTGMPVSVSALEYLGVVTAEEQVSSLTALYHLQNGGTSVPVLGDVLPVPGPSVVRSVVSIGDLLLMVGIVVIVLDAGRALARHH